MYEEFFWKYINARMLLVSRNTSGDFGKSSLQSFRIKPSIYDWSLVLYMFLNIENNAQIPSCTGCLLIKTILSAVLAQQVDHRICNQEVADSILGQGVISQWHCV